MGAKRPLWLALAISVLGHVVLVLLYPNDQTERRVARFDVELLPPEPTATAEPAADVPEEPPPPVEESLAAESEPVVIAEPESAPEEAKPTAAATILNLSRPPDWDQIVNDIPGPSDNLVFNPSLGEALEKRTAERRREALIASRRGAVYGVADDDYAREGVLGREIKRKGGCATLVEDKGVEEGQRWWASQCTETRQNPFTLPGIEYDALGRAVVD